MNLRVAAIIALVMFLGAQGLPAYRGFGGIVIGWQVTAELFRIGWDLVTHPSEFGKAVAEPDSFVRTVGILAWSGIAANGAMVAAMCLGLLQRTVPAFVVAAVAASVAAMLVGVLTWDGACELRIGGWLWTASILWVFAATGWSVWRNRTRNAGDAPPG